LIAIPAPRRSYFLIGNGSSRWRRASGSRPSIPIASVPERVA
jgi:hypothetical protein